jgi:galactokinase
MTTPLSQRVADRFRQQFETEPLLVRAPGRINLIGEHTDYNDGLVLPAAIDKEFVFAVSLNQRPETRAYALDKRQPAAYTEAELAPGHGWRHYLMGVQHGFLRAGVPFRGVDVVFGGNIPDGAGLSSSAALCCGFAFAIAGLLQLPMTRLEMARIAQYAEHRFAGVMCGIMDQYASLLGMAGHALLLDCRSLTHQTVPWNPSGYQLVLADTKVKHALASTAYNQRRAACEAVVTWVKQRYPSVQALRDVTEPMLAGVEDALGTDALVKARFVVREMQRVQAAVKCMQDARWADFGKLLSQTHWALSTEYEVSCEELDFLVLEAEEEKGVIGSRMMGGGFGGCTLNLVENGRVDYFRGRTAEKYIAQFEKEPDFYLVNLADGVSRLPA